MTFVDVAKGSQCKSCVLNMLEINQLVKQLTACHCLHPKKEIEFVYCVVG